MVQNCECFGIRALPICKILSFPSTLKIVKLLNLDLPKYNENTSEDMFWSVFISWLAFSQQLESTIFNSSLAFCLLLIGDPFLLFFNHLYQSFRSSGSYLWFHHSSCLPARGRLRGEIVLVPSAGSPKKSCQRRLLPDFLLQLPLEGCPHKVC